MRGNLRAMSGTSGVKFFPSKVLILNRAARHAQRITLYQELSQIWRLMSGNDDKQGVQSSQLEDKTGFKYCHFTFKWTKILWLKSATFDSQSTVSYTLVYTLTPVSCPNPESAEPTCSNIQDSNKALFIDRGFD